MVYGYIKNLAGCIERGIWIIFLFFCEPMKTLFMFYTFLRFHLFIKEWDIICM